MCLPSFFSWNNYFLYFLSVTCLRVFLIRFSIIEVIKINAIIPSTTSIRHVSLAFGISVGLNPRPDTRHTNFTVLLVSCIPIKPLSKNWFSNTHVKWFKRFLIRVRRNINKHEHTLADICQLLCKWHLLLDGFQRCSTASAVLRVCVSKLCVGGDAKLIWQCAF